jgi:histidine ammonia-lyase
MVVIGEGDLSLQDFSDIVFDHVNVSISEAAKKKAEESFLFLKEFSKNKTIYGINTGFGPMAQYPVKDEEQIQLQYNLIRSHTAGSGRSVPAEEVRAAMVVLLNNFAKGRSGVHLSLLQLLQEFINGDITPFVPEHGGVGASGDLVQLSHIAYNLIGEGEVFYQGELLPAAAVYAETGLNPARFHLREGLALINGTSFMTGISIINTIMSRRLLNWALIASSMITELVTSFDDYFSAELNSVKKHEGQQIVAGRIRSILEDSRLIRKRKDEFYNGKVYHSKIPVRVQEYYSIRCAPQIYGPVYDTLVNAERTFLQEANSVHDNPVILPEKGNVYHGGNFHGDYVSLESDKVRIAVTKMSMILERQLNFLMNDNLNTILPPFVNLGRLGINLGMQGAQFTATSTTAENQTLSFPAYLHSIPNNNDNQDIVSMGSNSALLTKKVVDNTFQVLSIEMISLLQAIDFLKIRPKMSSVTGPLYDQLRKIVPVFVEDTSKYEDIENVINYLRQNDPEECL